MSLDFYLCVCVRVWMCWCKWKFKLVTHLLLKREVSGHPVQHHHLPPEQRPALKLPCLMHSFTRRRLTKIVQDKGPPWRHRTHSTCPLLFFYGSVIGMKGISEIVLFFIFLSFFVENYPHVAAIQAWKHEIWQIYKLGVQRRWSPQLPQLLVLWEGGSFAQTLQGRITCLIAYFCRSVSILE